MLPEKPVRIRRFDGIRHLGAALAVQPALPTALYRRAMPIRSRRANTVELTE
jgi:hypothetical protein